MTKTSPIAQAKKTVISFSAAFLVAVTLAGCTTAGERRDDGSHRCSNYVARHHSGCMYMKQHHREREQLMNQEKALINAEQARENLRVLREIRRRRGEY